MLGPPRTSHKHGILCKLRGTLRHSPGGVRWLSNPCSTCWRNPPLVRTVVRIPRVETVPYTPPQQALLSLVDLTPSPPTLPTNRRQLPLAEPVGSPSPSKLSTLYLTSCRPSRTLRHTGKKVAVLEGARYVLYMTKSLRPPTKLPGENFPWGVRLQISTL